VIDAIRTNAAGVPCTIQFGSGGSNVLDIGNNRISLDGSSSPAWNLITFTGKITSSYYNGTIYLTSGASIASTADIANTGLNSGGVSVITGYQNYSGTVTISGGTVSADGTDGNAVASNYDIVNITGGTVSATAGSAVYNFSSGTVNISGGTVRATTGRAVSISSSGKITVSGSATVTSANVTATDGTIRASAGTVEITGGTVQNTASGNAVYTDSGSVVLGGNPTITSAIKIKPGKLSVAAGFAPVSKTYAIAPDYISGAIAVAGGSTHSSNFTLSNQCYSLAANGSDLVVGQYMPSGSCPAPSTYVITGSGSSFTARIGSTSGTVVGTANQSIANVIGYIKTHAAGAPCTIQFGDGSAALNIGSSYATFDNADGGWGLITLAGRITSSYNSDSYGTIYLNNRVYIASTADIANTATGSGNNAIRNAGGTVTISGGTVQAATGTAVYNSSGKITVSGTANVTSANVTTNRGTIYNPNYNSTVEITGGTVQNIANDANARAIYNSGSATVTISGGVVQAAAGYAVYRDGGTITLTGGVVFAQRPEPISGAYSTPSGNPAIVGWNKAAGTTTYTAFSNTDISASPSTATARWFNKDSEKGIDWANGANKGFIPISGVTVSKVNPSVTFPTTTAINYDPSKTLSTITLSNGAGAGTFAWQDGTIVPTVGNSGYNVVFTPTDAANYTTLTQNVTITVNKANPAVTWPASATITYGQTLASAVFAGQSGTGTFAYTLGTTSPTVAQSGTAYQVTFTPTDGANYNTLTQNVAITVNKANPTATFPTSAAITYGQTLADASFTGGSGAGTFAYTSGTPSPTVAQSGTAYQVTFTPTDGANYNTLTQNVAVTVNKATGLTATTPGNQMLSKANTSQKTFDLNTISLHKADHGDRTYTLPTFLDASGILAAKPELGIDGYTITYQGTGKESGEATLVVTITSQNYQDIDVTLTFEATPKAEVTISGLTEQNGVYDGSPKRGVSGVATSGAYTGALVYTYEGAGYDEIEYGPTSTQPTKAGEYTLIVSVPESDLDFIGSERYEFTIAKASIAKPAATNRVYNGSEQTAGITPNAAYTVTGDKETNVGSYNATVALKDKANYEWTGGGTADLSLAWSIAVNSPIIPQIANGSIKVLATANGITLENLPRNTKVEVYSLQGKCIYSAHPENPKILRIGVQTKGMYIVKVGSQTVRVAVR